MKNQILFVLTDLIKWVGAYSAGSSTPSKIIPVLTFLSRKNFKKKSWLTGFSRLHWVWLPEGRDIKMLKRFAWKFLLRS